MEIQEPWKPDPPLKPMEPEKVIDITVKLAELAVKTQNEKE